MQQGLTIDVVCGCRDTKSLTRSGSLGASQRKRSRLCMHRTILSMRLDDELWGSKLEIFTTAST